MPGVAGTWKDLTDNVNVMAANLTEQVRGIVKVVTAVANGELTQKLTVNAKGEVAALAETINNMTNTLATFADQVTTVAREVGVEGRLGGQANVPGAAGTWKDLTGNVNLLADNLTNQVRAIAEVATAVTKGDLDPIDSGGSQRRSGGTERQHQHDDRQLAADYRPQYRAGLAENKPRSFHRNVARAARPDHCGPHVAFRVGPAGRMLSRASSTRWKPKNQPAWYCFRRLRTTERMAICERIGIGEGLVGQCAAEKRRMLITDLPRKHRANSFWAFRGCAARM